jgi:hypothetical protein
MANEKKLQLGLHLPVRAAGSCSNVVEELRSRIDLEDFAEAIGSWSQLSGLTRLRTCRKTSQETVQLKMVRNCKL